MRPSGFGHSLGRPLLPRFRTSALAAFTLVLAYGGGLWLHLVNQATSVTTSNELPEPLHWLRDSTLAVPVLLLAVYEGMRFARWLLRCSGGGLSPLLAGMLLASSVAVVASAATGLASPLYGALLDASHQHGRQRMPALIQMAYMHVVSLPPYLLLAGIVCALFGGASWALPAVAREIGLSVRGERLAVVRYVRART